MTSSAWMRHTKMRPNLLILFKLLSCLVCKHKHDNLTNSFRDCNDLFGLEMAYKNSRGSSLDHKLVNIEPTSTDHA